MNYDSIILELMDRIKKLEERVEVLQMQIEKGNAPKITTLEIRDFILNEIENARISDQKSIVIRANEIHKKLKLKSRFPMVCNAMRQCMRENDKIIHETASGYSSSLEIEYSCE